MKTKEEVLFEDAPVFRAVLSLVVPTAVSQLITVVYNMADTFFIGQIGDPNQVAAVSLCMPMFVFLTGLANLFGIGGATPAADLGAMAAAVALFLPFWRKLSRFERESPQT